MLLAKIQAKIDSADSLLNTEIEGDNLLFEVELFESAYFGKDDLFEEERKALVSLYLLTCFILNDKISHSTGIIIMFRRA